MTRSERVLGCFFGLAFGDALGARTEFLKFDEILQKYPPFGPREIEGDPALVTDDTQMTLAVAEALCAAPRRFTAETLESELRQAFVAWLNDPENTRAPGMTCLTACADLERGLPWLKATIDGSKGCGANMRVAPVGLLDTDSETRAALAQFQAALTHGHPTALAASDLTAFVVAECVAGADLTRLPDRMREYARSQRQRYHETWLGDLWQQPYTDNPAQFIERGWDECLIALDHLEAALLAHDRDADPCYATGGGWVAEECLATGLLCFLLFPDDPVAAIRHASVSSGDSDSIACLTGAFAGAYHGLRSWPEEWRHRIEYRDRMTRLAEHPIFYRQS